RAERPQLVDGLVQAIGLAARNGQGGARFGQVVGDAAANPARCAGNDDNPPLELAHVPAATSAAGTALGGTTTSGSARGRRRREKASGTAPAAKVMTAPRPRAAR